MGKVHARSIVRDMAFVTLLAAWLRRPIPSSGGCAGRKRAWVLGLCVVLTAQHLFGCADPEKALSAYEVEVESGDFVAAEEGLRQALERHPQDVELLCAAAEFYLQEESSDYYKPRLALHYAMRADQAALGADADAARLLGMAHRAAGGWTALPEGEALLAAGLQQLQHPDAGDPQRLRPFDSDLLEPTLKNVLEQKLRWEKGRVEPTCPEDQLLVPEGRYPIPSKNEGEGPPVQTEVAVAAFCILRMPSLGPSCTGDAERPCNAEETAVVRNSLAGMLWGDPLAARCCYEPIRARVKR